MTAALEIWRRPSTLPALPANTIHIWRLRPADRLAKNDYLTCLRPEERERAGRLIFPADQQQSIASRGTLRLLLRHYTGAEHPRDLRLAYGEQAKPYLADSDLCFNLSHTRDLALFAFAREIDLGIDVENIRASDDLDAVAEQNFAPAERDALLVTPQEERLAAFYRCWTRKEALLKAEGSGLFRALDTFTVSLLAGEPARILAGPEGWDLRDIDVAPHAVAALAWGRREPEPQFLFLDCAPSLFSPATWIT
ncbi:MAG TPA: 4'-phosphopantetheinyl transferase superfamily protein [Acidobacteriaceae bacterium]